MFRDRDRGQLRAIHAHEGHQIGPGIHHGDVELPAVLGGLGHGGLRHRLGALQRDRRAIGRVEWHGVRNDVERVGRRRRRRLRESRAGEQGNAGRNNGENTELHWLVLPRVFCLNGAS